jgi:arylsulfatase
MNVWAARLRYWGGAVLTGVGIAVVAGLYEAMPPTSLSVFEENNYLGYRLYATATRELALTIDRWLPLAIGLAVLVAALPRIGRRGRGKVRFALRFVLPPLALVAAAGFHFLWYPTHWLLAKSVAKAAAASGWHVLMSPIGLLLPLALLVWIEWRILRARRPAKSPMKAGRDRPATRSTPAALRWLPGIAASTILGLLLVLFAVLHAAWGFYRWQAHRALRDRPNIIFIMVDTLRADHVGCYGYDLPTTPHIDHFARGATRFANAVAQAPYTLWSVTSMMSSRFPESLFPPSIEESSSTDCTPLVLAEILQDAGYATAAVVSNQILSATPLTAQGYAHYDDHLAQLPQEQSTSAEMTRAAIECVSALKGKKFFLSLVYMDPHAPYVRHPRYIFGESARDAPRRRAIQAAYPREYPHRQASLEAYDSEIGFTDHHIGQFLDALKRQGLYDDALIVFFSDHGEELLDHGSWGHRWTVYEEAIQVPLIIKFPRQREGRVVTGAFPLIDLVPSLLTGLGFDLSPLDLHGDPVDLASLLRCADKPLYSTALNRVQTVTEGTLKYIHTPAPDDSHSLYDELENIARVKEDRLFDLATDPLEQTDRYSSAHADTARLKALLQARNDVMTRSVTAATAPDRQLWERLKTLGYLNPGSPPTVTTGEH